MNDFLKELVELEARFLKPRSDRIRRARKKFKQG